DRDGPDGAKSGLRGRAAVAGEADDPGPSDGADNPVRRHPADVAAVVDDGAAAAPAERDPDWTDELGEDGRTAVAAVTLASIPGHGGDDPVRSDPPDAIVARVGDIERTVGPAGKASRLLDTRGRGRAPAATRRRGSVPGNSGNDAARVPLADPVAVRLSDVEAVVRADCDGQGVGQPRLGG